METQRVQMKGAPSWLVLWACRAPVQEIFFLPWLLLSALLTLHYYNSFVLIAQQAGQGQAAVQGRLSLSMYLWLKLRQIGTLGSTYERGPFLVGSFSLSCRYERFALAALVGLVQSIIFLSKQYFTSIVPLAQQAGHAVVPRRLS